MKKSMSWTGNPGQKVVYKGSDGRWLPSTPI